MSRVSVADPRLTAFSRGGTSPGLVVYIESDGAPWPWPDHPPADPTPVVQTVLRMASSDTTRAVGYLGRPCQYLTGSALANCDPMLWTLARFGGEAVRLINQAIDAMMRRHAAVTVDLVGYSGGGALALLAAADRKDVRCVVTVAAPLDTATWTRALGLTPLSGSREPADVRLPSHIRQTHLRGLRDTVVPPATTAAYFRRSPGAVAIDLADYGHDCCWHLNWSTLRARTCLAG